MTWSGHLRRTSTERVLWTRPPNDDEVAQQRRRTLTLWAQLGVLHGLAVAFMATSSDPQLVALAFTTAGLHLALFALCFLALNRLCRAWLERKNALRWARITRKIGVELTLEPDDPTPALRARIVPGEAHEIERELLPLDHNPPPDPNAHTVWTRNEVLFEDGRVTLHLVSNTDGQAILELADRTTRQRIDIALPLELTPDPTRPRIDREPILLDAIPAQSLQTQIVQLADSLSLSVPHELRYPGKFTSVS